MDNGEREKNNPSYFAIIPANVRYDKDLPACARLLYGEITALCNKEGYCWASNEYFADLYEVDIRTIKRWIGILNEKKYIRIETKKEGMKWDRKIWISNENEKISTKRQNCPDRGGKNVPIEETKLSPYKDINYNNRIFVKKDNVQTLPFKQKKETLEKAKKFNLTIEDQERLDYLISCEIDTSSETLCWWAKNYSLEKLRDCIIYAKKQRPKSIGAYVGKLLKSNAIVENDQTNKNAELARDYAKSNNWHDIEIGKKYVTSRNPPGQHKEIPLFMESGDFLERLMYFHDLHLN